MKKESAMISPSLLGVIAVVVVLVLIAANSIYTIKEWEQAIIVQFGEIRGETVTDAGLHFKVPFIQRVVRFDKRLQRWDGRQSTAITRDRRNMEVDVTARWRIDDARSFRERVNSVAGANTRLNGVIESAIRNEIAKYNLFEVVRSTNRILDAAEQIDLQIVLDDPEGELEEEIELEDFATLGRELSSLPQEADGRYLAGRPVVLEGILEDAREALERLDIGVHLEDVLIKQLNYTEEIETNVYDQMRAELQKISAGFRSQGQRHAEEKIGQMERELAAIESRAIERSERIRGEAEAGSITIYADAYNRDPGFYQFLRTLRAYEKILGQNNTLVIGTDTPLYRLLQTFSPEGELPGPSPVGTRAPGAGTAAPDAE